MLAADLIGKWRPTDPVSRRMASAYYSITNSPHRPTGACRRGCAVSRRSRTSTTGPPAGAEHRPHLEFQPQNDFALDGLTNRK
jgi:hypothetical protein